jgi:hypothetical protein
MKTPALHRTKNLHGFPPEPVRAVLAWRPFSTLKVYCFFAIGTPCRYAAGDLADTVSSNSTYAERDF